MRAPWQTEGYFDDLERSVNKSTGKMVAAGCAALLICGAVALAGCGDDDPIGDKCNEVCQVAQDSPCKQGDFVTRCIADCKALSGDATNKGYKGESCGMCIAAQFAYSGKKCQGEELCTFGGSQETCEPAAGCSAAVEKCFGAKGPSSMAIPECTDVCIEVDEPAP